MKDLADLKNWTPKKLRTLRNNLNNRLNSFGMNAEKTAELQKSHVLFGKDAKECKKLLEQVLKAIRDSK